MTQIKTWCVLLCTFFIISVCFATDDDDNGLEQNRHFKTKHFSTHHSSHLGHHDHLGNHGHLASHGHIGHHGHLGSHGHIGHHGIHHKPTIHHLGHDSHHGHNLLHKIGHLKLGLGLHSLHRRNAPQSQDDDADEGLIDHEEDVSQISDDVSRQERAASHFSGEEEIHPKSGPFMDVWSKKQKSNIYHSNPFGEHLHHESHINQHEDIPCSHATPPVSHHGPSLHHSHTHSHETELHHPPIQHTHHHHSDVHDHGKPHHILGGRPLSLGHRGHGILIQKELSIKKFRSADEGGEDNAEDETRAFDHLDENGVFGSKPEKGVN